MKVFNFNAGQDTAGQSFRHKRAVELVRPDWYVRAMFSTANYIRYPNDLPYRPMLAMQLYDDADVVHLHNQLAGYLTFDDGQCKPALMHHHGTVFRAGHAAIAAHARLLGMKQMASTVDLTVLEPDVEWLPSAYNLEAMAQIRSEHYQAREPLRIAHAPTNRAVKSTAEFLSAVRNLSERYNIEVDLIEWTPWTECIRRKARADIYYDQVILGYGCNSIEAWAMGIPVVAGVEDPKVRAAMLDRWGALPFFSASEGSIEAALETLIASIDARAEWAGRGIDHVRTWHDERVVGEQLANVYENLPPSVGGPRRKIHLTARVKRAEQRAYEKRSQRLARAARKAKASAH